jgi:uncharacterized protein
LERSLLEARWRGALRAVALGLGALALLGACSPHRALYPRLEALSRQGAYEKAAKLVEQNKSEYGDRNQVLWNLDRGVFYHYAGRYKESNEAFKAAEERMDELFTESITGNVAAFIVNDNTLPYRGEDFETVIVNIYRALNYVQLGDVEDALVEARKVDQKLRLINQQYPADAKNAYQGDAFARMLMGVFYQMGGTRDDLNDAYISDKLAADFYQNDFGPLYGVHAPAPLKTNLLSTATFMGPEELDQAKRRYPGTPVLPLDEVQKEARLYFVHFAGRGPTKVESAIRAVMPDGNLLKIAFPHYSPNYYLITGSRVLVDGQPADTLQEAQPIGAIAVRNLDDRKLRISAKAIARATTKYLANRVLQERARRKGDAASVLAWLGGNVYAELSEQADLRSWQTLPDEVLVGQVLLAPGKHRLQVQYTSQGGAVVSSEDLGEVEVQAGQTRFFILHTST